MLEEKVVWKAVYIARTEKKAETLKKHLEEKGIMCRVHLAGKARTNGTGSYEIRVLDSEAEEACRLVLEYLG